MRKALQPEAGQPASPQDGFAGNPEQNAVGQADRDIVALGIIVAAILLFVGTGSTVLTNTVRSYLTGSANSDSLLGNALILNIALIIFGWRRYVDLSREVSERRRAQETAQHLAQIDPLTGCLNRRSLDDAIVRLATAAAAKGDGVVVMMLDLDRFKRSNDLHGHQVGDLLLVETARRIRSFVPERAVLARLGGDEFLCAAPFDPAHPEMIESLVERINEAIAQPIVAGGCSGPAVAGTPPKQCHASGPAFAARASS